MTRDYDRARTIEDGMDEERAQLYAIEVFMHGVAGTEEDPDVGPVEAAYRALDRIEALEERADELKTENADLRTRLDRLGDIGEKKTSKEQKIAAVVTYADNERGTKSKHTLTIKNIRGAAGVSRRYAYTLADAMINGDSEEGVIGPGGFDWALDPADVPQYGSLEVDKDDATAGVTIDFEELHSNPDAVSKFITPAAAQEVAD